MWPNKWEKLLFTLHLCNLNVIAFKYFVLQRAKDITLSLMPWLNELVQNQTFSSLSFFLVLLLWSSFSWHTYASLWKVGKSWNAKSIPVCLWNQKNQIFSPPNRQLQSSSPSYKLSAYRTMPVQIGSDWRMQSVQTLMPPHRQRHQFLFPHLFPSSVGLEKFGTESSNHIFEGCSSCWAMSFGQLSVGEN